MQEEVKEVPVKLVNPITGEGVDEVIKEDEARKRGYLDFNFLLRHLEDENEFIKYFIVNGKKIIVDIARPNLQYKKPVSINHERIHEIEKRKEADIVSTIPTPATCSIDDAECISCGS